jgi:hypothetical protein
MRAGATDFVVKPVGAERLEVSLRNALATKALESEIQRIKRSHAGTLTFKDIITRSQRMHAVLRQAEKAAGSAIPVLIEGRSGVGKELIAPRSTAPANGAHAPSLRSIAAPFPTISSSRYCSATRRAPSPARPSAIPASSLTPMAARCSSTRSANFRWPRRSSSCAQSRKARSSRSAPASR